MPICLTKYRCSSVTEVCKLRLQTPLTMQAQFCASLNCEICQTITHSLIKVQVAFLTMLMVRYIAIVRVKAFLQSLLSFCFAIMVEQQFEEYLARQVS